MAGRRLSKDGHLHIAGRHVDELAVELVTGLRSQPKWLSPKWLYDARGDELFRAITSLPEYYLTRAEDEIIHANVRDLAALSNADTLIELGAGSTVKVVPILRAMAAHTPLLRYVPVDISSSALADTADTIETACPDVKVEPTAMDFQGSLSELPSDGNRMVALLGSTIGNLTSSERNALFLSMRDYLRPGESFLLGADLIKSPRILLAAYDDAQGLTAQFNLNVLRVLNRSFDADFDYRQFTHVAAWNQNREWIEMRLRSSRNQHVAFRGIGFGVDLCEGEEIRTEISAKFRRPRLEAELSCAHFQPIRWWTDSAQRFALSLSVVR